MTISKKTREEVLTPERVSKFVDGYVKQGVVEVTPSDNMLITCNHCGRDILIKWLKVERNLKCVHCGGILKLTIRQS
jgi:DNA-directed RNA polymerase subunit RPC12/RpoP